MAPTTVADSIAANGYASMNRVYKMRERGPIRTYFGDVGYI